MNLELTISSLQDKGHRITKNRREFIKIFSELSIPITANRIETILKEAGLKINKTTIYRELQFLLTNRYIQEIYISPHEVSYESADLKHHHHLVCDNCGSIDNVTNCLANELESDVLKKKGFKIHRHILEFYGTCNKCSFQA